MCGRIRSCLKMARMAQLRGEIDVTRRRFALPSAGLCWALPRLQSDSVGYLEVRSARVMASIASVMSMSESVRAVLLFVNASTS